MADFNLDYSLLCAVVAPDKIPLKGNEHRITRIAFDLVRLDQDKESLWQVQADDDGNEFLVRTYELPKEDEIQAKSEWNVIEDGKKASLTIAYRGLPVHRLVTADYGAQTTDDVKMLRDLVEAKLADVEFASKMLASMPESKRAALLETFPKLAAELPKIPTFSGNDPLQGIEPSNLKQDFGVDPKAKSNLPPPKSWKDNPQMAEDEKKDINLINPHLTDIFRKVREHFINADQLIHKIEKLVSIHQVTATGPWAIKVKDVRNELEATYEKLSKIVDDYSFSDYGADELKSPKIE